MLEFNKNTMGIRWCQFISPRWVSHYAEYFEKTASLRPPGRIFLFGCAEKMEIHLREYVERRNS